MSWDNYALATNKNDVEQTNMCNAHNSTQCNQINCFTWNKHLNRTKRQVIHSFEMRLSFNANADVLLRTNTLHLPSEYIPNCLARSFYWHKNKPKWSHSFFLVCLREERRKNMIKTRVTKLTIIVAALNLVHQFFVLSCCTFVLLVWVFSFNKRHQKECLTIAGSHLSDQFEWKKKKHR